jgi:signal transduction histidine kinase
VHPFDESICGHLVSDKHWITENMLCLLSNSIKYGDKGHVDVHVQVIDAPTCNDVPLKSPTKDLNSSVTVEKSSVPVGNGIEVRPVEDLCLKSPPLSPNRELNVDKTSYRSTRSASFGSKRIRDQDKKPMVLVTVEDSGIGICEEARKNLFQPFKQAQRMAGGTTF